MTENLGNNHAVINTKRDWSSGIRREICVDCGFEWDFIRDAELNPNNHSQPCPRCHHDPAHPYYGAHRRHS